MLLQRGFGQRPFSSKREAEQALGADSPRAGFFIKLRGRAAQAQRYASSLWRVMKILWCWRCRMELPMLDEEEFAIIAKLYLGGIGGVKEVRTRNDASLSETFRTDLFRPMREAYFQMTGIHESNENAIMHHRISLYGPACENCGKPLRTPRASFCAECGRVPSAGSAEA
jgi:hypothetical protein